jgi:hypothetical protein
MERSENAELIRNNAMKECKEKNSRLNTKRRLKV